MLYNVVLVSAVQHESAIKIRISLLSLPATPDPTPLFIFLIVSWKHTFFSFIYLFTCWVFIAAHRLRSSCGVWASHHGVFSLWSTGWSACGLQELWCMGLLALWPGESSQTRA